MLALYRPWHLIVLVRLWTSFVGTNFGDVGRRWSMLSAMFCLCLFSLVIATSENAASIFITRFFGDIFGSSPVSNVPAALGDIWEAKDRGIAVMFYAVAVVGGPTWRHCS